MPYLNRSCLTPTGKNQDAFELNNVDFAKVCNSEKVDEEVLDALMFVWDIKNITLEHEDRL